MKCAIILKAKIKINILGKYNAQNKPNKFKLNLKQVNYKKAIKRANNYGAYKSRWDYFKRIKKKH